MKVERFEQAHQLAEGQLITDAAGQLWKVHKYTSSGAAGETCLLHFSDEYGYTVQPSGESYALGDEAPLPWTTVKVVPDVLPHDVRTSTMCGGCGDNQQLVGDRFVAHTNRRTGEPCPGDAIPAGKPPVPAESLDWITRRPL